MTTGRCVCPGSYDPVTVGHVDVIRRAAALHDEVVVALLHNPAKLGAFTVAERLEMVRDAVAALPSVSVQVFAGRLLVDVCREVGAQSVVKGLRGTTDFAYELPMALMNRHLSGLETVFIAGDPAYAHISSSLVREITTLGGDITGLVTPMVQVALLSRLGPPGQPGPAGQLGPSKEPSDGRMEPPLDGPLSIAPAGDAEGR